MSCGLPVTKLTFLGSVGTKSVFVSGPGWGWVSGAATGTCELAAQAEITITTNKRMTEILVIVSPHFVRELAYLRPNGQRFWPVLGKGRRI